MAPRGVKRAAAAGLPEPRGKKAFDPFKEYDISRPAFDSAISVLEHPLLAQTGVHEDCRMMLSAAAPLSLCVPADQRHAHQRMAVEMMEEVVAAVEAKLVGAEAAEEAKLQELEGSRAGLDERAEVAEGELTAASATTDARKAELDAACAAVVAERRALSERQEEQKRTGASVEQAAKDKESLQTALDGPLVKLRDGDWDEGQGKALFSQLAKLMGKLKLDDSLVTALPSSMTKKPEERGAFDKMVVEQLQLGMQDRIRELGAIVEAAEPEVKRCTAAVEEAEGKLNEATQAQEQAAAQLNLAQEARRKATAELDGARLALKSFEPQRTAATAARDTERSALQSFQSGCLAAFQKLRDRNSTDGQRELKDPIDGQREFKEAAAAGA